jgi:hypothetical protein
MVPIDIVFRIYLLLLSIKVSAGFLTNCIIQEINDSSVLFYTVMKIIKFLVRKPLRTTFLTIYVDLREMGVSMFFLFAAESHITH